MGRNARRRKVAKERAAAERRWGTSATQTSAGRTIHFSKESELHKSLRAQLAAFEEKFGRAPGPDDPLFFDPDADTPEPISPAKLETYAVEAMRTAGMDPAYIYAYQQTGLMPTEENEHLISEDDFSEFDEAIERYRQLHPDR